MRLNDPLITSIVFEGKEYKIDLAFDTVLDVFDVLSDDALRDYERAEICLALLLGDQDYTSGPVELWNHIYKKYIEIERRQAMEYDMKGNPMPVRDDEDNEKVLDIEQDAGYIYASFQQAYGMNLYEQQGKLSWHEFKALLSGLPSDTIMQRIIQIRLWKPSKGESSEYKENMRKLQKAYALDAPEDKE